MMSVYNNVPGRKVLPTPFILQIGTQILTVSLARCIHIQGHMNAA